MNLRVLGWSGFTFLGAGLLVLLFGPKEWKAFGCGALLTAATLYVTGLVLVVRQIAHVRRKANEMLQRVAEELERRKKG
jgi:hypothetical protein